MIFSRLFAQQLSRPSRVFGPFLAPIWNRRNIALNDAVFDHLDLSPNDRVLEVGFGGGYLLGRMAGVVARGFIAGVDVSEAMVSFCEKRLGEVINKGRLELRCAAAESLPFPSGGFNKLCTVNSIFYWEDVPKAIGEFARVLEDGGLLVMCFTLKTSLENRSFAKHIELHEPEEIQRLMESHGFHNIRIMRSLDKYREYVCMTGNKKG